MEARSDKIKGCCPSGHHVRGDVSMAGRKVRCPHCDVAFVFAPPDRAVVVSSKSSSVTESSIMRILGDADPLPPAPVQHRIKTRPCPKCSVAISEAVAVCGHCKCYVGAMPSFLREMA
ncbi:hypothetical protein [Rubripirellula tenax]|uniref:hypothetical protein n=1 Tax=Rubripirellula tenax TaxID=2528015 RepID=UPI0011B6F714|nr:hypothetical protein [Rubripirellula tenax]